jgi:BlaI family penicillinase repressor
MHTLTKLSATETEVMQAIWELATPVTVSQLLTVFRQRNWKTSTMSTILARLIDKGFLTKEMKGKANYYCATLTLPEYQKYETRSLLTDVFSGNVKNLVAALVDEDVSGQDIDELKKWFEDMTGGA